MCVETVLGDALGLQFSLCHHTIVLRILNPIILFVQLLDAISSLIFFIFISNKNVLLKSVRRRKSTLDRYKRNT